jgi:hypothetical protein
MFGAAKEIPVKKTNTTATMIQMLLFIVHSF